MDLNIGHKVKSLRLASDLTQNELADRANLTKGFISQLENEQSSISVDSLSDILEALGTSIPDFFAGNSESQVVFSPNERVHVDSKDISAFELLISGSTNYVMDPIMLELASGEKLEKSTPHPGEEFGYVLSGIVTLILDKKTYRVPAKHCFYFKADRPSQLLNKNSSVAKLLWITTPPQM